MDSADAAKPVPAAKQRIVLATLLLGNGSTVAAADLAEALWDDSPPPNAPAVLRTYVTRLRQALGSAGTRIVGRPPGWAADLHSPEELDLAKVDSLWRAARSAGEAGEWRRMSSLLTQALSLWRGEPLVDVPSAALARREAGRLTELRLQLTEARIDADLHLGRHGELVAELRRLAAEHPLREHLRAQLMLACYRGGHQAAALAVYRDTRAILAKELGLEPSHELRELHQKILTADQELAAPDPVSILLSPSTGGGPGQAESGYAVLRPFPAGVRHFTGRDAELARLTEIAEEARADGIPALSVITGMAGVGKTALAMHWARQAARWFPDGQLYVNLRGVDPVSPPLSPARAIRLFLDGLRVPPEQIPASAQAQAVLYRSLLAERRMIIVVDNAHDSDQVRSLLPGSPGSVTLVTSRQTLTSLAATEGAACLTLDVLGQAEAGELLARRLTAARVEPQPDAAAAIAQLCGGLPLAVVIAAARAVTRPGIPIAWLADELADSRRRLDALEGGDAAASVRTAFSWSACQLTRGAARMLRLVALHPGPDITVPAAASLAGVAEVQARADLAELAQVHLAAECSADRFSLHGLIRDYAAENNVPCLRGNLTA